MKIDLVYLDLDGPILDVKNKYHHVHVSLCKELGIITLLDRELYWEKKRGKEPLSQILNLSSDDLKISIYKKRWLEEIERNTSMAWDEVHPFALGVLQYLKKKYQLHLITLRRNKKNTLEQIEKFQLNRYFEERIYIIQQNGMSPHILKHEVIQATGATQEGSIFIGDTEVDILAAKLSGILSVGVLSGIRNKKMMERIGPDFIVEDIRGLTRDVGL